MKELVFVIVIIGILSSVAIPKFLETATHSHDAIVGAYARTLTRSNGPTLWAMSQSAGNKGDISAYCVDLLDYTNIPDELSYDGDCSFTVTENGGSSFQGIEFTNGSVHTPPDWVVNK